MKSETELALVELKPSKVEPDSTKIEAEPAKDGEEAAKDLQEDDKIDEVVAHIEVKKRVNKKLRPIEDCHIERLRDLIFELQSSDP